MRSLVLPLIVVLFAASLATAAKPPSRPLPLTPAQFQTLRQLEGAPQHQAIVAVHATYASDHDKHMELVRASDDFWTFAYYTGFPGTVLALVICAAPY